MKLHERWVALHQLLLLQLILQQMFLPPRDPVGRIQQVSIAIAKRV